MRRSRYAILVVLLVLSACTAQAQVVRYGDFLESTADTVLKAFSDLSSRLVYIGWMWGKLNSVKFDLYDNLQWQLTNKPDLGDVHISSIVEYFIVLLQPVYVAAIIATAIYLMTQPSSPSGRSRAKTLLVSLLVGVFIISLTVPIIKLLLQTADSLTKSILSQGPLDMGYTFKKAADYLSYRAADYMWGDITIGTPFLILAFLSTAGVSIVLTMRFFLIIFLTIFFPVCVFLSLFTPTRSIGQTLIRQLVYWAFLPAGYALVALTTSIAAQNISASMPGVSDMTSLAATALLVSSPVVAYGLMNWAAVFASSTIVMVSAAARAKTVQEDMQARKTKAAGPASAVGMKGYVPADKGKKTKSRKTGAMTGEAEEGETSVEEEKAAQPQRTPTITRPIAPGYTAARDGRAEGEERARELQKRVRQRLNEASAETKTQEKKKSVVVMKLRPKFLNSIAVEIPPGESEMIEIVLVNDGNTPFSKVKAYDEDLGTEGFEITYGEQGFNLPSGQEKTIRIKVEAVKAMKDGDYSGAIVFRTENGIRSVLDMEIRVKTPASGAITKKGGEKEAAGRETEGKKSYYFPAHTMTERQEPAPRTTSAEGSLTETPKKDSDQIKERIKGVIEEEEKEARRAQKAQQKKEEAPAGTAASAPTAPSGQAPMFHSAGSVKTEERSPPAAAAPAPPPAAPKPKAQRPSAAEVLAEPKIPAAKTPDAASPARPTLSRAATSPVPDEKQEPDADAAHGPLQVMRRIMSPIRPHMKAIFLKMKRG